MFEALIRKIARGLDGENIPYMVIGGQAVLLYGTPRLTRDIDITVGVDTDQFFRLKGLCRKLGLKILPSDSERFVRQTKVLPTEETQTKIRVDFIFSFTPYERQAMERTRKVRLGGHSVKFASPEDVIIHKLFAGRAVDLEDVKHILLKHKKEIDAGYIRKWLSKLEGPPGKKLLASFKQSMSIK